MAESSFGWTTNNTGDGPTAGYSSAVFVQTLRDLFITDLTAEGVLRSIMNSLAVSGTSSPVVVATGAAIVYGYPYRSDASTNVTIPTPTTATRIDRIVLRVSWSAQTVRITRIAGTEGGGAPALTQMPNTTWDIPLAQVSITTGGVITVTDQRTYLKNPGVYGWLDENLTVTGTVTVTVINEGSAAFTSPGFIASRVGASDGGPQLALQAVTPNAADWRVGIPGSVGSEDFFIADNSPTGFGQALRVTRGTGAVTVNGILTPGGLGGTGIVGATQLASNAVTTAKIADANVTAAKIAADAVDDTQVGNRVPQFYRRQGGDTNNWSTTGTTTYTPGMVRMQSGARNISYGTTGQGNASATMTFPTAFSQVPIVIVTCGDRFFSAAAESITASGFTLGSAYLVAGGVPSPTSVNVYWLAIGTE